MKIDTISIKHFRSIEAATLKLNEIIALVGANNVGKSNVMRALNAFFNYEDERQSFLEEEHLYSKRSRPTIIVTFSDITVNDQIDAIFLYNSKLTIKFVYRWDRKNAYYQVLNNNGKYIALNMDAFDNLLRSFSFIYVPVIRNYNSAFSEEGIAYKLLIRVFKQLTSKRNNLQPRADTFLEYVENSIYSLGIDQIVKYYPFSNNKAFSMHTEEIDLIDYILKNAVLELMENKELNSIKNCGSGVQSAAYFAISIALSMGENQNYLVGIEEPELSMHPQAQKMLIESLKNQEKYNNAQFILTTHSTVIIDRIGHQSIALCRKIRGSTRDIITTVTQTGDDFWDKYSLDEERYYNFFDYRNSDFFFSDFIIMAESPNDCKVIQHLLGLSKIEVEDVGITLIPIDGESSIKYPYAICKELGIPFVCTVDRDAIQPYVKENKKDSLFQDGYHYASKIKTTAAITDLLSSEDYYSLIDIVGKNDFSAEQQLLRKYNIVIMRSAFELDLISCPSFIKRLCEMLGVEYSHHSLENLIVNYGSKIKRSNVLIDLIDSIGIKNLPKSYRLLIRTVKELLNS